VSHLLSELRGLLTALAVSLVTIGLGGLVSLQVGAVLAERQLHVEVLQVACITLSLMGFAVIGCVLKSLMDEAKELDAPSRDPNQK
jgi:uncharacterized membrane protein YhfC